MVNKKGKHKGLVLDLRRHRLNSRVSLPTPTAPPKYSTIPHPLLKLKGSALPPEASREDRERAIASFSSSVTKDTQKGYATAVRHYNAAHESLGRKFCIPPSSQEMVYFINFLLAKNLTPATVRHYISALRFYHLSQGVGTPDKLPALAEQLIVGTCKQLK